MYAIRLHAFGPAENLLYEQLPDLQPDEGQVRIAVETAGVHLIDTRIRAGVQLGPLPLPELPMVPGREVVGVVDALGAGVEPDWLGRRVVAHLGAAGGGYAEQALAPTGALHALPDALTSDLAIGAIGTGRTALAVLEAARLRVGDVVLVTAAAGGLGSMLVQAARAAGAIVVGVAGGAEKVHHLQVLGADLAVDYGEDGWEQEVREGVAERGGVTVVLDGVGGELGRAALELLAPGGRLILFGFASGEPTPLSAADLFRHGISATAAIGPALARRPGGQRALEREALDAAAAGTLVPVLGGRFPLAEAAAAHSALQTRATFGKTVLIP